ncbi:MAG: N-acetylmuramoyl-L-alanine amidase, partial [Desulfobulbaceae bacterium]|nr:N-acetylmuramoyl-L-alanine amidase [Desulfobulbaceae bacterium]
TDTFIELEERTAIANTQKADLFLSIHVNAHHLKSVRGIETFYLNLATNTEAMKVAARENATSTHSISDLQDILANLMQNSKIQESSRLAQNIHNSLISGLEPKNYNVKSLGVKQAPFYVLIGAQMPAILAEISFITNPEEAKHLKTDEFLKAIGSNIASGVAGYVENTTAALKL